LIRDFFALLLRWGFGISEIKLVLEAFFVVSDSAGNWREIAFSIWFFSFWYVSAFQVMANWVLWLPCSTPRPAN
jgi:hypothetical protein